jgi:transcription antitermination factor NusG
VALGSWPPVIGKSLMPFSKNRGIHRLGAGFCFALYTNVTDVWKGLFSLPSKYYNAFSCRMPILPIEPDIFPDDLLEQADPESALRWWALYTLSRREKDLIRRLRALNISHYAPLIKRRTRSPNGRTRISQVPLFAGYVFLRGGEDDRYSALKTNCISRCLTVDDPERLVRDLQSIRRLITSDVPLTPESRIEPGMRVRIRSGSLAGLEGTVVKRRGTERLFVTVEFLQQGASVQLDDFQVERIDR